MTILSLLFIFSFVTMNPLSITAQLDTSSNNVSGIFLPYYNTSLGVDLQVPLDWKKITVLTDSLVVITFQKDYTTQDSLAPSISLSIEHLPNNISLASYIDLSNDLLRSTFYNYTVLSLGSDVLDDFPAMHRTFTFIQPNSGLLMHSTQVFGIKDNKAYILSYTSPDRNYMDYLNLVEFMKTSFHLIKK